MSEASEGLLKPDWDIRTMSEPEKRQRKVQRKREGVDKRSGRNADSSCMPRRGGGAHT